MPSHALYSMSDSEEKVLALEKEVETLRRALRELLGRTGQYDLLRTLNDRNELNFRGN